MKANTAFPGSVLTLLTLLSLTTLCGCSSASGTNTTPPQATTQFMVAADSFNHRVLIFSYPLSTDESASTVFGQSDFTSTGHATTATGLYFPAEAIADSAGNVWVSDIFNNRIVQYMKSFTNGMAASIVLGQPDFTTGSIASPSQNGLGDPLGMAFDAHGNLWVADAGLRVLEFTPPFRSGMAATVVLGQPSFTAEAHTSGAAALNYPTEIAFDANGNLWVVDQENNRVLEFNPPFTTGQSARVVLGQPDFTSSSPATTATGLSQPYGIAIDGSGNVWISDLGNIRVLKFAAPFSNGQAASLVLGQPNFTTSAVTGNGQIDIGEPEGMAFDSVGNLLSRNRSGAAWSALSHRLATK